APPPCRRGRPVHPAGDRPHGQVDPRQRTPARLRRRPPAGHGAPRRDLVDHVGRPPVPDGVAARRRRRRGSGRSLAERGRGPVPPGRHRRRCRRLPLAGGGRVPARLDHRCVPAGARGRGCAPLPPSRPPRRHRPGRGRVARGLDLGISGAAPTDPPWRRARPEDEPVALRRPPGPPRPQHGPCRVHGRGPRLGAGRAQARRDRRAAPRGPDMGGRAAVPRLLPRHRPGRDLQPDAPRRHRRPAPAPPAARPGPGGDLHLVDPGPAV
ncbi:MAG: hypothetical protein AVDCRST_MAG20-1510, partial [uncultured Acidimicrobiales bacterium]